MSTIVITSLEEFNNIVVIMTGSLGPQGYRDQTIKFGRIQEVNGRVTVTVFDDTKFRIRNMETNGPILPHEHNVRGMTMNVNRPQVKVCCLPGTEQFELMNAIDLNVRAAFEFLVTGLGKVFPELMTFTLSPIQLKVGGREARIDIGFEVMAVLTNGTILPLSKYLPAGGVGLTPQQREVVGAMDAGPRIVYKPYIPEDYVQGSNYPETYVFGKIKTRVHEKTGRLYFDMNLAHKSFPNVNGVEVRKYLSKDNPYHPGMSDIHQWGITIPMLIRSSVGYSMVRGSDWTKQPDFRAVTRNGEKNNFVSTITFNPEVVMEGSGNVKPWWRCFLCKQPEGSSLGREYDYGEDIVDPDGPLASLVARPPTSAPLNLTSVVVDGDDYPSETEEGASAAAAAASATASPQTASPLTKALATAKLSGSPSARR